MKFQPILFFTMLLLFSCSENSTKIEKKFSELVWSDEFNYNGLPDSTKWNYSIGNGCPELCGWGNDELQYYTKELKNVRVENGVLIIETHKEKIDSFDFTSGKLVTEGIADWKYGKFEIRAKLLTGKGIWSAIWMLPTERNIYGRWPKCGEIDIMENVGYNPDTIYATSHTEKYNGMMGTQRSKGFAVPDCDEEFHTYTLEWEAEEYRVFVDEELIFTLKNDGNGYSEWPYDQRFHLILNIAYGGHWGGALGVDPDKLPQKMEVDWVRVYQ